MYYAWEMRTKYYLLNEVAPAQAIPHFSMAISVYLSVLVKMVKCCSSS